MGYASIIQLNGRAIFQGESGLRPTRESATRLAEPPGNWTATNGADRKLMQQTWERKTERPAKFVGPAGFRDDEVVIR